jgi:ribose-phosphate pyrophosphokinase
MISDSSDYILLTGRANPKLARDIAKILGKPVSEPISSFADGEIRVKGIPVLRRKHVFVIQPTSIPVNDSLVELIFMIDAAKRSSSGEITAIIPYFGYARQDRKEGPRVPISASVIAKIIEDAGADRIFTMDIHTEQAEGFVSIPWDNLYGSYTLLPAIKKENLKNLVIASPDKGGVPRATGYTRLLNAEGTAIVYKERDVNMKNTSKILTMIGDVKDKNVLLVDDMIDTGGTIVNAANFLKEKGAKSIRAAATHGLFSADALQKIQDSAIEEVIVTDSIAQREEVIKNKKMTIVSVAPLLAEAIKRIWLGKSLGTGLIL